ncbi:MAG: tyrosine-type recombinase/integrase [Arcobacteraceae bacterium]|nr:tyrosine-type recombinase/integrase [Arcobacteraceae bacterium]
MLHSISVRKDGKKMANSFIKDNKIWIDYNVDGKRYRKSTGLSDKASNHKIVNNKIIPELSHKIATGEIFKKKPKTFRYYGEIFLKFKEARLRAYSEREPYFKRLIKVFEDREIDKITRLDVKEYLFSLKMKTHSKGIYKSAIKEIFEIAVDDGVININPAINIKLPPDRKEDIEYFSVEEVNKMINSATGIMKPYLLLAFNTGMRPEEILGLQFQDIQDDYIDIKRVRTKGRIDYPKTKSSFRKIPYPSFIKKEIEVLKNKSLFLFDYIDDAGRLRHQWLKVIKDSGVKYRKLYSTRHTFATLMLKDNIVSLNELAGLLGHSSPKVTLAHYASIINPELVNLGKNFSLFGHDLGTIETREVVEACI